MISVTIVHKRCKVITDFCIVFRTVQCLVSGEDLGCIVHFGVKRVLSFVGRAEITILGHKQHSDFGVLRPKPAFPEDVLPRVAFFRGDVTTHKLTSVSLDR